MLKNKIIKSILFIICSLIILTICFSLITITSIACDEVMVVAQQSNEPTKFMLSYQFKQFVPFGLGIASVGGISGVSCLLGVNK